MARGNKSVRITLLRSLIGRSPKQRATIRALGLGRLNSSVVRKRNSAVVGMVNSVSHLVKVEDL